MSISIDEWQEKILANLIDLEYGAGLLESERTGEGFPVYGSSGIVGKHRNYLVEAPGIVVGRKGSIGSVFWTNEAFYPIDTTYYVQQKTEDDLRWIYWYLTYLPLHKLDTSTGVPGLNRNDAYKVKIFVPPPPEQQKIAQILDTIDQLIAVTDTHITKLKKTKAGLLHDLLTRGIDEHGELRDPTRHPEQFQDSPLGRIPKDWEFGKLCNFYAVPARNGLYKPAEYYGQGNLMIHMPQMFRGLEIDASDAARVEVSSDELERFSLCQGDLVFARRSLNLEGAGRCSLVPQLNEATTFESSIIRVRLSKDELVPTFANYFLNSEIGERLRLPLIRQVAVSGVSSEDIASLPIPKPSVEEQNRIISQIETYEKLIQTKELQQEKLKLLKKGLMTDLLTGKVRVKTDPTQEN
ncbi:restriction endonuclease subunit S [Coleofasciculus sp. G2-EDA-02]|uniref:restriction endonuclease subunit S n=1 Tax=Coleofasciculus sp. G2-EDA-02 TaxID=3069529 RepID=UPI0032F19225